MDNITKQDRITLKNLKVADFASEVTTVLQRNRRVRRYSHRRGPQRRPRSLDVPPRAQRQGGATGAGRSLRQACRLRRSTSATRVKTTTST